MDKDFGAFCSLRGCVHTWYYRLWSSACDCVQTWRSYLIVQFGYEVAFEITLLGALDLVVDVRNVFVYILQNIQCLITKLRSGHQKNRIRCYKDKSISNRSLNNMNCTPIGLRKKCFGSILQNKICFFQYTFVWYPNCFQTVQFNNLQLKLYLKNIVLTFLVRYMAKAGWYPLLRTQSQFLYFSLSFSLK